MPRIATSGQTKAIIRKNNFSVKKSYGQNFLIDTHVLDKIIRSADIGENDLIIEIGPGIGGLTQALAETAKKVIAIEIDAKLIPVLQDTLASYDNVELIHADVLKVDFHALLRERPAESVKVVANLPYYITTPIVMSLLESKCPVDAIIVMVQKEVAARMAAKAGAKDYGALSLAVQYYCEPYLVANVPRNSFMPRPGVDSAVIKLTLRKLPPVVVEDEALLFALIKCAFAMRRKTLLNCLFSCEWLGLDKTHIKLLLGACGFDEHVRGETLNLADFARLAQTISSR